MEKKSYRRTRVGRVVADNSAQTIKVQVEGTIQHPKYKKYIKRSYTYMAHDPEERCKLGDLVRIEECRPISKLKKWVVREVIERADEKIKDSMKETRDDSAGIDA